MLLGGCRQFNMKQVLNTLVTISLVVPMAFSKFTISKFTFRDCQTSSGLRPTVTTPATQHNLLLPSLADCCEENNLWSLSIRTKETISKNISQALPAGPNYDNQFHAGFAIYGIPVRVWFLMPSSPIHIILGKLLLVVSRCPVALFWQIHYLVYCLIYAGYPTKS